MQKRAKRKKKQRRSQRSSLLSLKARCALANPATFEVPYTVSAGVSSTYRCTLCCRYHKMIFSPKSCQAFLVLRKILILRSPQRRWRVGCGAEKFWPEEAGEAKEASTEKEEEVPELSKNLAFDLDSQQFPQNHQGHGEKFGLPGVRGLVAKCPSGPWNGCALSSDLIVEYPRNVRAVAAPSLGRLKKMKNLSKQSWKKSSQWRRKQP